MKNKPNDIPYLGCRADKIKSAQPVLNTENFRHLHRWIIDRYAVHVRKDVKKLPAPWTDNPIIREYRFTNVRREHDKESTWVRENVCNANMSLRNKWMNLILFRMINKSETCKNFMPINFDCIDWQRILDYVVHLSEDYSVFTSAFYTSGLKRTCARHCGHLTAYQDKEKGVPALISVLQYCKMVYDDPEFIYDVISATSAQEKFDALKKIDGIGYFLAYQILVDWTWCPESLISENEFVVAGIGARWGLDLVFDNRDGMTYEEALFWLRDNWLTICGWLQLPWNPDEIFVDLDPEDRYMNVMSLQNCHCEISKYIRAVNGTGRPRNKYHYKEGV